MPNSPQLCWLHRLVRKQAISSRCFSLGRKGVLNVRSEVSREQPGRVISEKATDVGKIEEPETAHVEVTLSLVGMIYYSLRCFCGHLLD
jgi:hypothetical protein